MIHSVKENDGSVELTFVPPAKVSDEYRELCWLGSREARAAFEETLLGGCAHALREAEVSGSDTSHPLMRLHIADRDGRVSPHVHVRVPGVPMGAERLRRLDDVFSRIVGEQFSGCLLEAA